MLGYSILKLNLTGTNYKSVQQMYNSHEEEKKKEYGPRVLQVEKATMKAAVMRPKQRV